MGTISFLWVGQVTRRRIPYAWKHDSLDVFNSHVSASQLLQQQLAHDGRIIDAIWHDGHAQSSYFSL